MKIEIRETSNPDGLRSLVRALACAPTDQDITLVFSDTYLYSAPFPVIAAWAKHRSSGTHVSLDVSKCKEPAARLIKNVGLNDIVESGAESPYHVLKAGEHVPLQPIVPGHATTEVLDRVHRMVDDWAGYKQNTEAFRTILSELAENVLVHSDASTPGYVHARIHRQPLADKCEITFADSGIGIRESYLAGTNEEAKKSVLGGGSALQLAVAGLNSSKPMALTPFGKSHFGYGLNTVKRLIERNRGKMTIVSGEECLFLDNGIVKCERLPKPWHGTIVSLVIDLGNPLPLEEIYEEQLQKLIPEAIQSPSKTVTPVANAAPSQAVAATISNTEATKDSGGARLKVSDVASRLLARETGLVVRAELATLLADQGTVEVDLEGVEDITPSVADECFGKLAERLGAERFWERVHLKGGTPVLHRLIRLVVANRAQTK